MYMLLVLSCSPILGKSSNKNRFNTMPAHQHNQPRGGFAPGGTRTGTSATFVRMASALISCHSASAIYTRSLAICVTALITLLLACRHLHCLRYSSTRHPAIYLTKVSLLFSTNGLIISPMDAKCHNAFPTMPNFLVSSHPRKFHILSY